MSTSINIKITDLEEQAINECIEDLLRVTELYDENIVREALEVVTNTFSENNNYYTNEHGILIDKRGE